MDTEEDALLLVGKAKDNQIIDDQIESDENVVLNSENFSNGNCSIVTSPAPSRRSDEPTELSFEKSKKFLSFEILCFVIVFQGVHCPLYHCRRV